MVSDLRDLDTEERHDDPHGASSRAHEQCRARVNEDLNVLRTLASDPRSRAAAVTGDVLLFPSAGFATACRPYANERLIVDFGGRLWDLSPTTLQTILKGGLAGLQLATTPLLPRASDACNTLLRVLTSGHRVLLWRSPEMESVIAWLQSRGIATDRLVKALSWIPDAVSFCPPCLEEWVRLGCPGEPVDINTALTAGRTRWAIHLYEAIFPVLLSARQGRDGIALPLERSRAILTLLTWLRDSSDTALRVAAVQGPDTIDAGDLRCTTRMGMLLTGVPWRIVSAEEVPGTPDQDWISYLYSDSPVVAGALAGAGWDLRADLADSRVQALAQTETAEDLLLSSGLIGRRLGSNRLTPTIVASGGALWRRGAPVNVRELVESTGEADPIRSAAAARLAYHVGAASNLAVRGVRRRIKITMQRAQGAAEFPPPTAFLTLPADETTSAPSWVGVLLHFRIAMPVDRRRRDLAGGLRVLGDSMLCLDPLSVATAVGQAAATGLLSVDSGSLFYGRSGEALGSYICSNLAHIFQPEYIRWVRHELTAAAASEEDLRAAILRVVGDLSAVLVSR